MNRLLALAVALAALSTPAAARAGADGSGLLLGLGYGLHRTLGGGMAVQDYDQSRAFDGYYLSAQAGYQARWGGLVGLDFAFASGANAVRLEQADLRLEVRSETLSALLGGSWGPGRWLRLHLGLLAGVAFAQHARTFRAEGLADTRTLGSVRPALGLQAGFDVLPLRWLLIGARIRADLTLPTGSAQSGLGGLFLGLSTGVVL